MKDNVFPVTGDYNLYTCELSIEFEDSYHLMSLIQFDEKDESQTRILYIIERDNQVISTKEYAPNEIGDNNDFPDEIRWLARGFAGIPSHYKKAAVARGYVNA